MDIKVEIFEGSSFPVAIEVNGLRTYVNLNDAKELRSQLNNIIEELDKYTKDQKSGNDRDIGKILRDRSGAHTAGGGPAQAAV